MKKFQECLTPPAFAPTTTDEGLTSCTRTLRFTLTPAAARAASARRLAGSPDAGNSCGLLCNSVICARWFMLLPLVLLPLLLEEDLFKRLARFMANSTPE